MKTNTRAMLVKFNGSSEAPTDIVPDYNYWQLIGEYGTIVDDNQSGGFSSPDGFPRILVKFDVSLDGLSLENHNHTKNSHWVRTADLVPAC